MNILPLNSGEFRGVKTLFRAVLFSLFVFKAILLNSSVPAVVLSIHSYPQASHSAIGTKIDSLLADPKLKGGMQGVVIRSLKTDAIWYERNPDHLFMPASNNKLLTTAAVLTALGPKWKFITKVVSDGRLDEYGTLHGDLILKGSGDPLLSSSELDALAKRVAEAGVKKIDGHVLGDDTRFDRVRIGAGWEWDDLPFYYCAPVGGLNLDENVLNVTAESTGKVGRPPKITITPMPRYSRLLNRARIVAAGKPSTITISRTTGVDEITVDGHVALNAPLSERKTEPITVMDPTRYTMTWFVSRLKAAGIQVAREPGTGKAPADAMEIARHESAPLSEVLKKLNKPSDNLVGECLIKTLGAEKGTDGIGSWPSGLAAAKEYFKSIGMDTELVKMVDGSGLSRFNVVTPRNYARMMLAMVRGPYSTTFVDSLAIAGVDGTIRNRMKGTPAENNCKAKSGYISGVSSLSGFVKTASGEMVMFVIIMNNHQCSNTVASGIQNRIVELLAREK